MTESYETIRRNLEVFLPSVGARVMELRRSRESDQDFARIKADRTLVTRADEQSEDLIRTWIGECFPDDTIRGEERRQKQGGVRHWIVDPIDGTYNFNQLGRMFSISVGLVESNKPRVGVLFYPFEGITLSASLDDGAWMNANPLTVLESRTQLQDAQVIIQSTELHREYFSQPRFAKSLAQQARLQLKPLVIDGVDASLTFAFLIFIQGDVDAILHPGATAYDVAAMCAIAKELKLMVSDYDGQPLSFSSKTIPIVVSKNPQLHGALIEALNLGN